MQLKKIKLAGFKSFVEPTTVSFLGNRMAIVGPNGCGKSNIIDAVRWVMGESSAKQLRGELMADVIFNGTSNRKPVGQASVELVFDNTDTMLTGEYAKYNEIAIRREINRDGMSNYYLNGARCRRKDIVDIFLGTGLGSRSYAVIEQGMISQLIEAKPDDLRIHLEEAAGISKYKERRRETENRIRHTKDNLARLNDIRQELEQQISHLKRQANAANRYKTLKQEQRLLKAQLQALHWRVVNNQINEQVTEIAQKELNLDAKQAQSSKVIAEIEALRNQQTTANDVFNEVQRRFYSLGTDIGRLEQQIEHNKERCSQLSQDLLQVNSSMQEAEQHINSDSSKLKETTVELEELAPLVATAKETANNAELELTVAEQTMQEWQILWDNFNNKAAQSAKRAEVEQTRIAHLEQQLANENQQLDKLKQELVQLDSADSSEELAELEAEYNQLTSQSSVAAKELIGKQEEIIKQRSRLEGLSKELDLARNELQKFYGKYSSLEILQETALGRKDRSALGWLEQNQLTDKPRLAQGLQAASGWEKAVEIVLNTRLEAVCLEDIDKFFAEFKNLEQGHVTLFDTKVEHKELCSVSKTQSLADKVQSDWPVGILLANVYVADSLNAALSLRRSLQPHESVITKDGVWLGSAWVSAHFAEDAKWGVLQREQEIRELSEEINSKQKIINEKELYFNCSKASLEALEKQREELQTGLNAASAAVSKIAAELSAKETEWKQLCQRKEILSTEITEYKKKIIISQEQLAAVHGLWQTAEQNKLSDDGQRISLLEQRDQYRETLKQARENSANKKKAADGLIMRLEFVRNQLQYLRQSLERAESQIVSLKERKENIISAMKIAKTPLSALNQNLEQALEKRLAVENELSSAKQKVENVEHDLREQEAKRSLLESEAQEIRSRLEQCRLEWKALQVRCAAYEEQITDLGHELAATLQGIPETAELPEWEEKLAKAAKRIERLGPINLAAIGEFEQKSERKQYLDAQNEDLETALRTLESAIHKIDRETKAKFRQTFETVNAEFQKLFPLVFGGGKACLEMAGDDLLSSGVVILAQPPGKRNSTIHLLSGGEKALTAIALVFSIFQLNPAPFCMLDEVDAPLDDNNVVRFCNLVKEMSEKIQFIFVSHNKITMEMAGQLTGITMQEPGVSRIVSVDVDTAVKMAE